MWVFGLVDTQHTPALGFMEVVPQRTASTLLPIINQHVAPGTIVHTDEWSSYSRMSSLPNVASHATVNHSITFVDPTIRVRVGLNGDVVGGGGKTSPSQEEATKVGCPPD